MGVFDAVLSYGKSDFIGHGKLTEDLVVKKGKAPEIEQIKATHGSHSETTHSSSK